MEIFRNARLSAAEYRLREEALYQEAHREIESGVQRKGLWAKSVADSKGVESLAISLYIKYRVQSMLDEKLIISELIRTRSDVNQSAGQSIKEPELEDEIGERWVCAKCGERHELQFEDCWKCGTHRTN